MTSAPTLVRPPSSGALVAVTGASGGVGASVVAATLAVRAVAMGRVAVAVDLDHLGGGLDVVLGLEQTRGTRWSDLGGLDGEADGAAVLPTLPRADGVWVLSHGRDGEQVPPPVVGALVRSLVDVCDLVVLDLPRTGRLPAGVPPLDCHLVVAGTDVSRFAALSSVLAALARGGEVGSGAPGADDERGPSGWDALGVLLRVGSVSEGEALVPAVEQLGAPVWGIVPHGRLAAADLTHGVPPGRRSGPLASALDPLVAQVLTSRTQRAAGAA